jgi:hypothetical protein
MRQHTPQIFMMNSEVRKTDSHVSRIWFCVFICEQLESQSFTNTPRTSEALEIYSDNHGKLNL